MFRNFRRFLRGEDGAVTVDWMVLTGSALVLSAIGVTAFQTVFVDTVDTIVISMVDTLMQ